MGIFSNDYTPYLDKHGLVQPKIGTISGNGVRFSCECIVAYYIKVNHFGYVPDQADEDLITKIIQAISACEIESGLLARTPANDRGQQSFDDTICYLALYSEYAARFIERGENPTNALGIPYVFNNLSSNSFSFDSWLGRSPALIAHAYFSALTSKTRPSKEPNLFLKIAWLVAIYWDALNPGQDSKILSWFMVYVALNSKDKTILNACLYWKKKTAERYPLGLGSILQSYYGFEHPNAKHLAKIL